MQFLKTLFWVVLAAIGTIFAYRNWSPVSVNLWGGIVADIKLPLLMLASFLLGFIPLFTLHRVTRWRMRRRLETARRELEEARGIGVADTPIPAGAALQLPASEPPLP
jgi:uncharacterized integral membrane protein